MYETKMLCLIKYLKKVKGLLENFDHFELKRILQLEDDHVGALTKLVNMKTSNGNWLVIQSIMLAPSTERNESMCIDEKES